MTGQCYLLGDDLQVGKEERTWRRVVCDTGHLDRRPKNQDWFAYCQQGHGASFAKDNSSLLFGAPGAYQWKGKIKQSTSGAVSSTKISKHVQHMPSNDRWIGSELHFIFLHILLHFKKHRQI